ncbi:MAG: STAS/SEC14 domain-containing protein [Thiohalocapsa sp.]
MIELINELPDNVIGIRACGRVTNEECDEILRPAMQRVLDAHRKIRLYYEIGSRFPGAGWEDLDVAIDHMPQWERIAVVTDTGWVRQSVNALRFLLASEVRVFTSEEAADGRAWVAATAADLPTAATVREAGALRRASRGLPRSRRLPPARAVRRGDRERRAEPRRQADTR